MRYIGSHQGFCRAPCAVLVLLALASEPVAAQKSGTLTGIVLASGDETPVAARLTVQGTILSVVATQDGAFRIVGIPSGAQSLDVHMLGYLPIVLPVEIRSGESLYVRVVLKPVPLALEAIDVAESAMALTPQLRGFEDRRSRGMGVFFTHEDILRMQPRLFTDILRRVPGMQIRNVQGGHGDNVSVQNSRSKPCAMQFYVNAMPIAMLGDAPVNYYVSPEEVVGVEVYSGSSEIPPQFNSSMNNSRCGVVVVWTRVGKEPKRSR
jgi:hypothetical protein